ncbi:J domain-containing protein [Pseudomonas fluorescens]|uniref:J domain-containing protein n=1 Tax=Pseudomonas fluorescens TaxID=294 RepID=UPI001AA00B97|nr:J domain-containing protein [Pseudomonas fluorescens]
MHNNKDDTKGYYAVLGLTSSVGAEQINTAYRRRTIELHPDHNPGTGTTQQFQFLKETYAVPSDPASRAEYDSQHTQKAAAEAAAPSSVPAPIICSLCANIPVQPKVVVVTIGNRCNWAPSVLTTDFLLLPVRKGVTET